MADPRKNVLVIDDDAMILSSISRQLRNEPLQLELEANPLEGIEKLTQKDYDLVLCDIKMKPISGLEVLSEIKDRHPNTPVIIISAFVDDQLLETAQKLGCSAFLIKPVQRHALVEAIRRILA
ncbi:MAG: hypothetical protein CMN78_02080 [Spirochaetales bacterium]|nr:hypothetical protein [Spirochaetales bacterium]